jgi:uncharacterized membrane protein
VYGDLVTFGASFLGSAVESVEALTIVLAVGLTRGWRAPLYGTVAALAVLAVLVLTLGGLITSTVPEGTLKLVIGSLILLFGLRWLHRAILRSGGAIAMNDEAAKFNARVQELRAAGRRAGLDWIGFVIAFKGVFLEGLEVAFIVFAVGASSRSLPLAAAGGLVAMAVVASAGVLVHRPLARVPENTLKFAVGLILASLGTFWATEGMGIRWPGDFLSIFVLAALFLITSRVAVAIIRGAPGPAPALREDAG